MDPHYRCRGTHKEAANQTEQSYNEAERIDMAASLNLHTII